MLLSLKIIHEKVFSFYCIDSRNNAIAIHYHLKSSLRNKKGFH